MPTDILTQQAGDNELKMSHKLNVLTKYVPIKYKLYIWSLLRTSVSVDLFIVSNLAAVENAIGVKQT